MDEKLITELEKRRRYLLFKIEKIEEYSVCTPCGYMSNKIEARSWLRRWRKTIVCGVWDYKFKRPLIL